MIFNPETITPLNARSVVDAAYESAGITAPTIVDAVSAALAAEPSPHELAVEYATAALDNTRDADELVNEAVARITRAQALAQFRDTYERTVDSIALERIDTVRDQAVADLKPAFTKIVKRLTTAATKLDQTAPLDPQRAFETDTTVEVKTAGAAIADIARICVHPAPVGHDFDARIGSLLRVVNIPDVTMERFGFTAMRARVSIPDDDTPTRDQIRAFFRAAQTDPDGALVKVARGDWPTLTLSLADTTELARRATAAAAAGKRTAVDQNAALVL